ncbi:MAG: DUF5667 domain-containing protein [Patescibacteria group bacterium]
MKTTKKILAVAVLYLAATGIVFAQEAVAPTGAENSAAAEQMVALDETVTAAQLGVSEPTLLPNSPFYFLKNWSRAIQSAVTFNPVKKAELRLKFTNEKLVEAKKIAETSPTNTQAIKKALDNYQAETVKLNSAANAIKETVQNNPKISALIEKLVEKGVKQQKILNKIEKNITPEAYSALTEAKNEAASTMTANVTKLGDSPRILADSLNRELETKDGSEFKAFQTIEIMKIMEAKAPEAAKEALIQARQNAVSQIQAELKAMPVQVKNLLPEYIKQLGGNEVRQMEIIRETTATAPREIKAELEKAKDIMWAKTAQKLNDMEQGNATGAKELFINPVNEAKIADTARSIAEQMTKVEKMISNLAPSPESGGAVPSLTENAKKKLEEAKKALSENKIGEAFGQVNAAYQNALTAQKTQQRQEFKIEQEKIDQNPDRPVTNKPEINKPAKVNPQQPVKPQLPQLKQVEVQVETESGGAGGLQGEGTINIPVKQP